METIISASLDTSSQPENAEVDGWKLHDGLSDPGVYGRTPVEVRFRDGDTACGVVFDWDQNWQWATTEAGLTAPGAIVAWRIEPKFLARLDDETRNFNETMSNKTPRVILAAVRRLVPRNKKPNWSLAMEVFGVGSTYGHRICTEYGIDPDATTLTPYDTPYKTSVARET